MPNSESPVRPHAGFIDLAYQELRAVAAHLLKNERVGHGMAATSLVHEAFLRICRIEDSHWQDREHFLAVAVRALRRVLINHAEARAAQRRGGGWSRTDLDVAGASLPARERDLLTVNELIEKLSGDDERCARIIELRFFGGLTVQETARVLGVSTRTVEADWTWARAWLRREIERSRHEPGAGRFNASRSGRRLGTDG